MPFFIVVDRLLGRKPSKKAKVMHEYKAANPDELNLEVGQVIEILKQVFCALLFAIHAMCTLIVMTTYSMFTVLEQYVSCSVPLLENTSLFVSSNVCNNLGKYVSNFAYRNCCCFPSVL